MLLAACTTVSTPTPSQTTESPLAPSSTTAIASTFPTSTAASSTTLPPEPSAPPRLEVWIVPGHGTPADLGPFVAVLADGTIYVRDFRAETSGSDPVWTGRLSDPSQVESLVADLPRGGDSTFGLIGMDGATLFVVLDGEPITALWGPWHEAQDPQAQAARELAIEIVYDQLASREWWDQSGLTDGPLRLARLDGLVGQVSEFLDQLPPEALRTAVRVPWPDSPPGFEDPRVFECFFVGGPAAAEVAEVLAGTEEQVVWTSSDLEFFTVRERWLFPYETPCEPDAPLITARQDD